MREIKKVSKVVMLRHGDSVWNEKNLFCGWVDSPLSEKGLNEARSAGEALKKAGLTTFDVAFTSALSRTQVTLNEVMSIIGQIPNVASDWHLCERHYGALTGLNKAEVVSKFGETQVRTWRRSYNIPPPPMTADHPYYKVIRNDERFSSISEEDFPAVETLELTMKRVVPFWKEQVLPQVRAGKRVLIIGHGTSLRGIIKALDQMSDEAIMKLDIPTGMPFYYDFDTDLNVVQSMQFLADPEDVKKGMDAVAAQGKAKKCSNGVN